MKSNISIIQANLDDLFIIHQMQIISFKSLLDKYQDYDNSPGAENIEKITMRFNQPNTTYYLIQNNKISIGAIRIVSLENGQIYRISPIFIIPEYQNKGIAQKVFKLIEKKYKPTVKWILDTILQEKGNCHLYEKMGYTTTGEIISIKNGMSIIFYEKNVALRT